MPKEVAIATVDGRAYYTLTRLLKDAGLPFDAVVPGEQLDRTVRLVITTRKENSLIEHHNVICLEDLGEDITEMRQRLFGLLYGGKESTFVIGVDPGERIGVAAYYPRSEVEVEVFESIEKALDRVERLIQNANAAKKVVRIGYGKPDIAGEILRQLRSRGLTVSIELVDERGTSSLAGSRKRKETRDQRSARIIALKRGRKVA